MTEAELIVGQKRTVRGRQAGVRVGRETKDDGCLVFSLRCRDTCQDHEIWEWGGQEGEVEADGFSLSILGDGGSNAVDGDGGGDGDVPDRRDSKSRRT